jgi:hypothetical protein
LDKKVKTSCTGIPVEPGTASERRAFTVVYILWIKCGLFLDGVQNMSKKIKYIPAFLHGADISSLIPYRIKNYMYYTTQALRVLQKF